VEETDNEVASGVDIVMAAVDVLGTRGKSVATLYRRGTLEAGEGPGEPVATRLARLAESASEVVTGAEDGGAMGVIATADRYCWGGAASPPTTVEAAEDEAAAVAATAWCVAMELLRICKTDLRILARCLSSGRGASSMRDKTGWK